MEETGMRNNYFFTLIKFVLSLIIFCFLIGITMEVLRAMVSRVGLRLNILYLSLLSTFAFYTFVADLNGFYNKIQRFFFRSAFFSLIFSALLIVLGVIFFLLPKVFHISVSSNLFLFLGGFAFTSHLIYIAREMKGTNFAAYINYFFIFIILYILNFILFGLYLKVGFPINLGDALANGVRRGAYLIQSLFMQLLK